ncbi:MAG: Na/Pi cotransporter family protein [Treponema sp.]|nr:Na/Pi cotransporter family protein [Treponema sp.]
MKEIIIPVLNLIGSLGFLLYGMKLMSDGVQKSAGEKLQRALSVITGNRFVALLTGLVVTMIIQSSGASTVMVVTFVNAGLMSLAQSVGVIFGANIGTTITAWIVSIFGFNFKISAFAIPVFGFGYFLTVLIKKNVYKNLGEAIMGFGLLFFGLSGLSDVFQPEQLGWLFNIQGNGPLAVVAGFFIGIIITALLHSSSAFSAIVIVMAAGNLISWELAAAMTLGSNIGSTIDAILAAIGKTADARRSALIHVMFNVFGTVLVLIFFRPFLDLVVLCTPGHNDPSNMAIRISMFHTIFKVLSTVVLLPMQTPLVKLACRMIKDKENTKNSSYKLEFINLPSKDSITTHIIQAEKAIADMTDIVSDMFDKIQIGVTQRDPSFIKDYEETSAAAEEYVDQMHEQITHYLIKCEQMELTEKQIQHISTMIQIVDELEDMSDNCYTTIMLINRSIEKKMKFQPEDEERLLPYIELARQFLQFIRRNINTTIDAAKLELARELEDGIDAFRIDLKKVARKRLESGANVKAELLYIDIVRSIEHIGDNCFSISESLTNK